MGKKKNDSAPPRLRKETIRKLAERTLAPGALQQVAGGGASWQPRYTQCCG